MFKKYIHHIYYYSGLVAAFVLLGLYAYIENTKIAFMYVGIFASVFYVGWALLHHYIHHEMHLKIVLEYVIIGVLGISAVYFMLSIY